MLRQVPCCICHDVPPVSQTSEGLSLWRTDLGPACKHRSQSTAPQMQDWQPSNDLGTGHISPTLS